MSTPRGGRFRRLFGRGDESSDDPVELAGNDAHAWWADRRSLSGAPGGAQRSGIPTAEPSRPVGADASTPGGAGDGNGWSASSLFADAGFEPSGPAPPPPTDDGATTVHIATDLDEARLILGVPDTADWPEIVRAHRRLAFQFHPDRLGDLSADAQELGEERMAEINQALDRMRASYQG